MRGPGERHSSHLQTSSVIVQAQRISLTFVIIVFHGQERPLLKLLHVFELLDDGRVGLQSVVSADT